LAAPQGSTFLGFSPPELPPSMRRMRVLLTGCSGYVGSVARGVLDAAGHEVVGLDTALYDGCDLAPLTPPPPPELQVDLRDVQRADLDGIEAVVHLAALSNDPLGEFDETLTYAVNHEAGVRLARLAKAAGATRFVFASSCSMYGASGGSGLVDETAPLAPLTAYAGSKVRSEESLARLASDDFSPIFLRFATAYGVSPRLRLDIVLNNLVGSAIALDEVRLQSDGMAWRPLIHVEDMARACLASLESPREAVHAEAFNTGSPEANYLIRDLAEIVADVVAGSQVSFAAGAGTDPRSYKVDFSKISSVLPDFRCEWDARKGAESLASAYRAAAMGEALFHGDRFTRLARLRRLLADGRLDGALRWQQQAVAAGAA
jgi:nucleoside-diphosphate-sugar epimerase